MPFAAVVGIALGLALDAFSVSAATSLRLRRVSARQIFRFAFHFGLFQALMPALGWSFGHYLDPFIRAWDHWLAFALLSAIGAKAVYGALSGHETDENVSDPTRGWSLVALSLATSIDAMAVGLSFALLDVGIAYPCFVIGVVTAFLSAVGMIFGSRLAGRFGPRVEAVGGFVLILIGVKILADHGGLF